MSKQLGSHDSKLLKKSECCWSGKDETVGQYSSLPPNHDYKILNTLA